MAPASAFGIEKDMLLRSITELKNQLLGFAFTKSLSDFSIYSGIAGIALSLFKSGFLAESRSIIHTRWRDAMYSVVNTQEIADLITGPIGFMFVACMVLCNSSSIDEEDKFKIALDISSARTLVAHVSFSMAQLAVSIASGFFAVFPTPMPTWLPFSMTWSRSWYRR